MGSFSSIGLTLLAACLLVPVANAVYNIFFHPLRRYPGPRWNAVTRLPYIVNLLKGRGHLYTLTLHEQYGDVVRINPDELSYIAADAWRDIYGGRNKNFEKDHSFLGPDLVGQNGLIRTRGVEDHARIRKAFSHAFSDRAIKDQEFIVQQYVNQLVSNIRRLLEHDTAARVPISDLYNFTTFDVMGDLTFGEPLGLLANSEYNVWVANIFGAIKLVIVGRILRWYPLLNSLFRSMLPKKARESMRLQVMYTVERVDKRLARGETDRPDVWTLVMKHDDSKRLSYPEMLSSASTFMIAGTETTATLLSGLTFLLVKNPDVYAKLVHEIRSAFQSSDEIRMQPVLGLEYVNACISEALRMYPPVPIGMPRIVPPQGAIVCGQVVPGGTVVSVPQYAAYHSARKFRFPHKFIPERWLGDPQYASDSRDVVQPFSYGPRDCLGRTLAYHEMRMILTKVLFNFDLKGLWEESEDWINQDTYGFWEKPKLMVKLSPRVS